MKCQNTAFTSQEIEQAMVGVEQAMVGVVLKEDAVGFVNRDQTEASLEASFASMDSRCMDQMKSDMNTNTEDQTDLASFASVDSSNMDQLGSDMIDQPTNTGDLEALFEKMDTSYMDQLGSDMNTSYMDQPMDTIDSGSGFSTGAGSSQKVFECETIDGMSDNFMELYTSHIEGFFVPAQDDHRLMEFEVVAQSEGGSKFVSLIPATTKSNSCFSFSDLELDDLFSTDSKVVDEAANLVPCCNCRY